MPNVEKNVGELIDYLKQFPKNYKVVIVKESNPTDRTFCYDIAEIGFGAYLLPKDHNKKCFIDAIQDAVFLFAEEENMGEVR
jgi:hypothetical protein